MKYLLSASIFLVFFATSLNAQLAGKIKGDRYYSPDNVFSVEIPSQNLWNHKLSDSVRNHVSYVTFDNDLGAFVKVELYHLSKEVVDDIQDKDLFLEVMEDLFNSYAEGDESIVQGIGTKKEVLEKKHFSDVNLGNVFFGTLKIPNASGMTCVERKEEMDAIRGYLYTLGKEHLVLVTVQLSPVAEEIQKICGKTGSKDYTSQLLKQSLKVCQSIRFGM